MSSKMGEHDLPQASKFPIKRNTMLPADSFKDRVVFITGGGTGLGKGMATKFSEMGAKVVIAARYFLRETKLTKAILSSK